MLRNDLKISMNNLNVDNIQKEILFLILKITKNSQALKMYVVLKVHHQDLQKFDHAVSMFLKQRMT